LNNNFWKPSVKIITMYLIISIIWICFSDLLLTHLIHPNEYFGITKIATIKGCLFVLITSAIFYHVIDRDFKYIRESEDRYRKLVENSPEITFVHIEGEIVYVNQAGVNFIGAENASAVIGKNILNFVPQKDHDYTLGRMRNLKKEGKIELAEQKALSPNGLQIPIETIAFKTTFQGKDAVQVIVRDITERKIAAEQINYLAYFDTITTLPNRNSLNKSMKEAIEKKESFALMLLDLDRFKYINDNLGHDVGDLLLKKVSYRLKKYVEDRAFLSRYGGDEFVILLKQTKKEEVENFTKGIIEKLSSPFILENNEYYITTSIGISMYPIDGDSADVLMKNADTAMYAAKDSGRNAFRFIDHELDIQNKRKMEIERGIRNALKNNEFQLFYQPQVNLNTGKVMGVEALLRWQHPKNGMIPPTDFIPIAEETGIIVELGEWVLQTACKQLKAWQLKGLPSIRVAVNVSIHQFLDENFVTKVAKVLNETGLSPNLLELEITESVMQNYKKSIKIMEQLKELGLEIALDDFGTGYSSLSVLKHLPIDNLKIDKSFIDDLCTKSEPIVKSIIQMGKNLNFTIVAEGIEKKEQLLLLKKYQCHIGQGYYFCKPIPSEEAEKFLRSSEKLLDSDDPERGKYSNRT
jgi:diguanylate cyclase (GGDEF)-like protein/PAS domain S-box-containing protein